MSRRLAPVRLALIALALTGCGQSLSTEYGYSRGSSLNGTSAFAELLRQRDFDVTPARSFDDPAFESADVLIRFSPTPDLPDLREWSFYEDWLAESPGRRLLYVGRDYNAEADYWAAVLAALPANAPNDRARAERNLESARRRWLESPAPPSGQPEEGRRNIWFTFEPGPPGPDPAPVQWLGGLWSVGIDPEAASLTQRSRLDDIDDDGVRVLLDDHGAIALRFVFDPESDARFLVIYDGAFLLNGALLNPARRPLAAQVVQWLGDGPGSVVFVEGSTPWEAPSDRSRDGLPTSLASLGNWRQLRWVAFHLIVLGLIAAFAASVRLGRPRPEPPTGTDRPAAHAEALGDLLARTRDDEAATFLLDNYRRWRAPKSRPDPG